MRKISLKCACGSEVVYEDGTDMSLGTTDPARERGLKCQVEVFAALWLDEHRGCIHPMQAFSPDPKCPKCGSEKIDIYYNDGEGDDLRCECGYVGKYMTFHGQVREIVVRDMEEAGDEGSV